MFKVGDLVRYKQSLLNREIQYIVGDPYSGQAKIWGVAPLVSLKHLRKVKDVRLTSKEIWK